MTMDQVLKIHTDRFLDALIGHARDGESIRLAHYQSTALVR